MTAAGAPASQLEKRRAGLFAPAGRPHRHPRAAAHVHGRQGVHRLKGPVQKRGLSGPGAGRRWAGGLVSSGYTLSAFKT